MSFQTHLICLNLQILGNHIRCVRQKCYLNQTQRMYKQGQVFNSKNGSIQVIRDLPNEGCQLFQKGDERFIVYTPQTIPYNKDHDYMRKRNNDIKADISRCVMEEKRIVAFSFIKYGFNLLKCRSELINERLCFELDANKYKFVAACFATDVVRKMQYLLNVHFQNKFIPLSLNSLSYIMPYLMECKTKVTKSEYLTFTKYIKFTFELEPVTIGSAESRELYSKFCSFQFDLDGQRQRPRVQIFKKETESLSGGDKSQQNEELNKQLSHKMTLWNLEYDTVLINGYKQYGKMFQVRDILKEKYGSDFPLAEITLLYGRMKEILRQSLRNVQISCLEVEHILRMKLEKVTDKVFKKLLNTPSALPLRIKMSLFYLNSNLTVRELADLIISINTLCQDTRESEMEKRIAEGMKVRERLN